MQTPLSNTGLHPQLSPCCSWAWFWHKRELVWLEMWCLNPELGLGSLSVTGFWAIPGHH